MNTITMIIMTMIIMTTITITTIIITITATTITITRSITRNTIRSPEGSNQPYWLLNQYTLSLLGKQIVSLHSLEISDYTYVIEFSEQIHVKCFDIVKMHAMKRVIQKISRFDISALFRLNIMQLLNRSTITAACITCISVSRSEPVYDCAAACSATASCANDPHGHSSYCKFWQTEAVCFGLYWKSANSTEMCFFPNEPSCSEALPVLCNYTTVDIPTTSPIQTSTGVNTVSTSGTARTTGRPTTSSALPSTSNGIVNTTTTRPSITMAPSTRFSSTLSPTTSTSTVSSSVSPLKLSGRYCGSSGSTNRIGFQTNFQPSTVDITLTDFLKGSIANVPYVYDSVSGLVTLTPTPAYVGFLNGLPLFLVPEDIVVIYNEPTDRVLITVLGVKIEATHTNCNDTA
jgi:hypothetical protein